MEVEVSLDVGDTAESVKFLLREALDFTHVCIHLGTVEQGQNHPIGADANLLGNLFHDGFVVERKTLAVDGRGLRPEGGLLDRSGPTTQDDHLVDQAKPDRNPEESGQFQTRIEMLSGAGARGTATL